MAALALLWLVLLPLFALVGAGAIAALRIPFPTRPGDRLLASAWLGMLACASALLLLSIALPLAPVAGPATLVLLAGGAALSRAAREEARAFAAALDGRVAASLAALLLGVAVLGSKQVTWYDSGLYHYGMVRWLAEHGTVPGLALLHSRFGITSSWFALSAALEVGPLAGRTGSALGGFVVLLAALRFVLAADRVLGARARPADWFAAIGLVLLAPFILWMGASATPDLPVLLLTLVVAEMLLAGFPGVLPFALACAALTLKVSSLPLAAVTGLALLPGWRSVGTWARVAALSAAALLPLAAAGLAASGCPLYPSTVACVDAPWSIAAETARLELKVIHEWARWEGTTPPGATEWSWVRPWLGRGPLNAAAAGLLALSAGAAAWLLARRHTSPLSRGGGAVLAIALLGSLFVLWSAPAPRFLWAYATLPVALAGASLLGSRAMKLSARSRLLPISLVAAVGVAAAGIALGMLSTTIRGSWSPGQLVLPARMEVPPTELRRSNDLIYRAPLGAEDRCWGASLPCSPYVSAGVRLRDPSRGISAGFVRDRWPPLRETLREP